MDQPAQKGIESEVHSLGMQIAGLHPLVTEVHSQMPRIAEALETLAMVTAKLENNTEDHKRIHYRITGIESSVKTVIENHGELEARFEALKEEHIVCITTKQVERRAERTSWWAKAKAKAAEKVIEITTLAIIGFIGWMVISHLKEYPPAAQIMATQPAHKAGK